MLLRLISLRSCGTFEANAFETRASEAACDAFEVDAIEFV